MTRGSPTYPPPVPGMSEALRRNIRIMDLWKEREEARATPGERLASSITRFTGSMASVYLHVTLFGVWALINFGLVPGVPQFDPTFVLLATLASVEGIFLTTFVLVSQNRMAAADVRRADLDLHIYLLAVHELTNLATLVGELANKLDIDS